MAQSIFVLTSPNSLSGSADVYHVDSLAAGVVVGNMINGFDLYTVECAVEAETHTQCDVFASDIATLLPERPAPANVHSPVIWLHNGTTIVGGGMDGFFYFWNNQGKLLRKHRHGDTLIDITVCSEHCIAYQRLMLLL